MDLTNWTPMRDLDRLFNRLHPLNARVSDNGPGLELFNADLKWRPAADITENKDEFIIKADLPEVDKDDIELEIADGMITLRGERRYEKKSEDEKQHRVESFYGHFERSFSIPSNVDEDAITAESAKGVLTVRLPKRAMPESESRKIRVD
jgi:HSP20 family protein